VARSLEGLPARRPRASPMPGCPSTSWPPLTRLASPDTDAAMAEPGLRACTAAPAGGGPPAGPGRCAPRRPTSPTAGGALRLRWDAENRWLLVSGRVGRRPRGRWSEAGDHPPRRSRPARSGDRGLRTPSSPAVWRTPLVRGWPRRRLQADADADRASIVVHCESSVMGGDQGLGPRFEGRAPSSSAETARRLACDSRLAARGRGGGPAQALGLGAPHPPGPPGWLSRQLRQRDGGCRFPGLVGRHPLAARPPRTPLGPGGIHRSAQPGHAVRLPPIACWHEGGLARRGPPRPGSCASYTLAARPCPPDRCPCGRRCGTDWLA